MVKSAEDSKMGSNQVDPNDLRFFYNLSFFSRLPAFREL